jgi:opacity protein-like surface antigen
MSMLTIAAFAGAAQAASLTQGTSELTVDGLLDPDGASGTELSLDVGYGYFVQDNIEVGGEVSFADNDDVMSYGLGGFAEYNLDQGTALVPFVGAGLGWVNTEIDALDVDDDAIVAGIYGGVKYFLAENIALTAQINLDWASEDIFLNDGDVEDTNIDVTLGMRFFLP